MQSARWREGEIEGDDKDRRKEERGLKGNQRGRENMGGKEGKKGKMWRAKRKNREEQDRKG
jgi:hypothetical protein